MYVAGADRQNVHAKTKQKVSHAYSHVINDIWEMSGSLMVQRAVFDFVILMNHDCFLGTTVLHTGHV